MIYKLVSLLPKNFISYLVGLLFSIPVPRILRWPVLGLFSLITKVDLSEAELNLREFASIQDLFCRRLKPDLRPVGDGFCSPADGRLQISSPAVEGMGLQVKGKEYSLLELVGDPQMPHPAWQFCIYLAPHNYHRVHSPIKGSLTLLQYIPGDLWPVNFWARSNVPGLFSSNERLVFHIEAEGGGTVQVVMVGAINVGKIQTRFWPGFAGNRRQRLARSRVVDQNVEAGDELGVFMLGSTVVMTVSAEVKQRLSLNEMADVDVRVGESLESA